MLNIFKNISIRLVQITGSIIISGIYILLNPAYGWEYDDQFNRIYVSGSVCRGSNEYDEQRLRHVPGETYNASEGFSIFVYCPLNRRNVHAYSKQLAGRGVDIRIKLISVIVESPTQELKCRTFAKDVYTKEIHYSDWKSPADFDHSWTARNAILFIHDPAQHWESVNYGVLCDVPTGEAVKSISMVVENENF